MSLDPKFWWYLARATGMTSWAFATLGVISGLLLSGRVTRRPKPNWQNDLHRHFATISLATLALHLGGLFMDSTVSFGPKEMLVPFASSWKPAEIAAGVVALYLLAVVQVTSLLRGRITKRTWARLHRLSLGVYVLSTVHFLSAGSERRNPIVVWTSIASVGLVAALLAMRVLSARRAALNPRASARRAT